jgi:hypothetical protein
MPSSRREAAALAPRHDWIVRAWKWGAGSLSAGAALVSILSSVRSITGAQQVRWIGVAPAADTAFSLGDTLQLATTITDGHGGVLPGIPVGWTSTDTSVATVDSAGAVLARSPGGTTIVAAAGGHIAQARILVRPRPAAIRFYGDTLVRLPEAGSTRIVARVVDARGHPVLGQPLAWRSGDPAVAAVDSLARLTAVTAGHTVVVAASGELSSELPLEVYPVPGTITLLAGDGQHAPAGRRLPAPIRAQIVSRGGRPLPDVAVRLATGDGSGGEQALDTSNADGIVELPWTLTARPGRQRIALVVDGDASIATFLTADADPLPDNTRIAVIGTTPAGRIGSALPTAIAVRVTDTAGAPLADLPVTWSTPEDGSIEGLAARTDSLGEARARWTLGDRAGTQQAFLQVGFGRAVPRFPVVATARPGPAAALTAVRGGPPRGVAGEPLDAPLELRVTDRASNPVPGAVVQVRPAAGTVAERSLVSDSAGRVLVRWTLGPLAGPQRLAASAQGVERPTEVVAQARAGAAAHLALDGVPPTATAGAVLPQPVTVVVTDSLRNPVSGTLVTFTSRTGKLSAAQVRTDSTGRARTRWTLGSGAGEQRLEVVEKRSGQRAAATVRATAVKRSRKR